MPKVALLFIGGAGDKERFTAVPYLAAWGPTGAVQEYLDQSTPQLVNKPASAQQTEIHHFSYYQQTEIRAKLTSLHQNSGQVLACKPTHQKKTPFIAVVAHSYGASCAYRLLAESQIKINTLILVDPVGAGRRKIRQNWQLAPIEKLPPPLAKNLGVVIPKSAIYRRGNLIALLGGAWRHHAKLNQRLKNTSNKYIIAQDKSLGHAKFNALMHCRNSAGTSMHSWLKESIDHYLAS